MLENVKVLVLSIDDTVKTFNSYNRWVTVGTKADLSPDFFINNGCDYTVINTSTNTIKIPYVLVQTFEDGTTEYETQDYITSDMGVTDIQSETDALGNELAVLTVPTFIPVNLLASTDKLLYYSSDVTFKPYIDGLDFSSINTHSTNIYFNIKYMYNYNENVKFRFKMNSGSFSKWSSAVPSSSALSGVITVSQLLVGANSITVEVSNETETKVTSYSATNAITLDNESPNIIFVSADSDAFKLHFKIVDNDNDRLSYKLSITNSKYTDRIIRDWSSPSENPIEDILYIDTSLVVYNETNYINVSYKDSLGDIVVSQYQFTGNYRNLIFKDEDSNILSTDRGVILKKITFDDMIAGLQSSIKKISIINNNNKPVTDIKLKVSYLNKIDYADVLLSKTLNPFKGYNAIDYGTTVLGVGEGLNFYIIIDTSVNAQGISNFDIVVDAKIIE